jgi:hypothetical protein
MKGLVVACADVGSMAGKQSNFGWYASTGHGGCYASELVTHLAECLAARRPVALGFECPLFLPLRGDERRLTGARPGEGSKAWSAAAGCGAMGTGLVQAAFVLQQLREACGPVVPPAFVAWSPFMAAGEGLFLWEAFVTGAGKRESHVADARHAVETFVAALPDVERLNALPVEGAVLSVIGAVLLRTQWSVDAALLSHQVLVVKPGGPPPSPPALTRD